MSAPLKVGILRLGRVAGKTKFSLIDESDISIVEKYAVEGRMEVDRNGCGAAVYAYVFDFIKGRKTSQKLHEMLWEKHRGGIAPGWKVVHKNQVTMDNRLDNLCLVKEVNSIPVVVKDVGEIAGVKNTESSLYWMTVQQLMSDPSEHRFPEQMCTNCCDGQFVPHGCEESVLYYECHYPPCSKMEREVREFSICGRCQFVRYCSPACQEQDWPMHKYICRERQTILPDFLKTALPRDQSPDR